MIVRNPPRALSTGNDHVPPRCRREAGRQSRLSRWGALFVLTAIAMFCTRSFAAETRNLGDLVIGDTPGETFTVAAGETFDQIGNVTVRGTGSLLVLGTLRLNGNLNIQNTGRVTVNGGEFHLRGDYTDIVLSGNGVLKFQNNALLHYVQSFVIQHRLIARDAAQIQLTDTTVDCDGSSEAVFLYDFSAYLATNLQNATEGQWRTWYMENSSSLSLRNVPSSGDIVFYDDPTGGPNLYFENSSRIFPWLHFDTGAVADLRFPVAQTPTDPVSYTITNNLNGVTGIHWSLRVVNCTSVGWGIDPFPGTDITIRDSILTAVMWRFRGTQTQTLNGFMVGGTQYADDTVPLADRSLRLINTYVLWWKPDVWDQAELRADGIVFSEMIVQDQGKAFVKNSVCEGQTIHVGVFDEGYAEFDNGEIWSFVSVWNDATLVVRDSLVDWQKGQFIYQKTNIAHQKSRLYSINSTFREPPQAYDQAVAMVARVDPPAGPFGGTIPITGSAWLSSPGPVAFARYQLSYSPAGSENWTLFGESTSQVLSGVLGVWDRSQLPPGPYQIRLVVLATGETTPHPTSDYPAYRTITLEPGCSNAVDGTVCDDDNACTQLDTCQSGACTGSNPVVCVPSDTCHAAGVCAPATGVCSNPVKPNRSPCEDGNICTANDTCDNAGNCIGGAAPACTDGNVCTGDACDPSSGCVHGSANLDTSGYSTNRIDGLDLIVLADAWNSCSPDPRYDPAADLDPISTPPGACVDESDFHLFMNAFGASCL